MGHKSISGIVGGILIAVSIVVGAFLISDSSSIATTSNEEEVSTEKSVFTIDDLAEYLSVSTKDIEEIIEKRDKNAFLNFKFNTSALTDLICAKMKKLKLLI